MRRPSSVFVLHCKYDDEDTEIAGVYDDFDSLVKGFRSLIMSQPLYPVPSEQELDDLCADLEGKGPDDECDFNGCVFGWEEHKVHYKEELDGCSARNED